MKIYLGTHPVHFNSLVHVDETAIGGNVRGEMRWYFGIVDKEHHNCHIELMSNKNNQSKIPIIGMYKEELTYTVMVPMFTSAWTIEANNHHFAVHKDNYVDPVTGIHTNYIENLWSLLKLKIKAITGSPMEMLDGYIDEFIYRYNWQIWM